MPTSEKLISEWFDKNKFNHLQLGTIVTSILNFEQFCILNEDPIPSNFNSGDKAGKKSKWAPLDGRKISGSKLAPFFSPNPVLPDARGMFLRGLNTFDIENSTSIPDEREVPMDGRLVGEYQNDTFKKHSHSLSVYKTSHQNGSASLAGNVSIRLERTGVEGDDETRPKNIVVYYYIRIN